MLCVNTSKTIRDLWRDQGLINLSPEYQRNQGVWNDEKKALLIDSVLNGFDIPKLYLHNQDEKSRRLEGPHSTQLKSPIRERESEKDSTAWPH